MQPHRRVQRKKAKQRGSTRAKRTDIQTAKSTREMGYLPIEQHGIIGDLHTAALVGTNGTIDFLCFPRFDSPSVFAALVDDKRGGYFSLAPAAEAPRENSFT